MSVPRQCAVCGGHVKPMESQDVFGSCENCGLVYAIGTVLKEVRGPAKRGLGLTEIRQAEPRSSMQDDTGQVRGPSGPRWKCPDCDTLIEAANETDLEFLRRGHIREYHPNRPA